MAVSVAVHQPVPDRTQAVWLDLAPDLSCTDSTQAHWVDVEHQPTDLAVGGSNPSRRAPSLSSDGVADALMIVLDPGDHLAALCTGYPMKVLGDWTTVAALPPSALGGRPGEGGPDWRCHGRFAILGRAG